VNSVKSGDFEASSRLADMSRVAQVLGYNFDDLDDYMNHKRVQAISEGDSWLASLLEVARFEPGEFMKSFTYSQLKEAMVNVGAEGMFEKDSRFLGKWLNGKKDLLAREGIEMLLKKFDRSTRIVEFRPL